MARRFRSLGGGEAQERLNATYRETNANLVMLNAQLEAKTRETLVALDERNRAFRDCKAELDATAAAARRERNELRQEIDDLRDMVRELRSRVRDNSTRIDVLDSPEPGVTGAGR